MNKIQTLLAKAAGRHDIILAVMLVVAVFMMIIPLPTPLIDVLNRNQSCVIDHPNDDRYLHS